MLLAKNRSWWKADVNSMVHSVSLVTLAGQDLPSPSQESILIGFTCRGLDHHSMRASSKAVSSHRGFVKSVTQGCLLACLFGGFTTTQPIFINYWPAAYVAGELAETKCHCLFYSETNSKFSRLGNSKIRNWKILIVQRFQILELCTWEIILINPFFI